jgi:hypothetical protein
MATRQNIKILGLLYVSANHRPHDLPSNPAQNPMATRIPPIWKSISACAPSRMRMEKVLKKPKMDVVAEETCGITPRYRSNGPTSSPPPMPNSEDSIPTMNTKIVGFKSKSSNLRSPIRTVTGLFFCSAAAL